MHGGLGSLVGVNPTRRRPLRSKLPLMEESVASAESVPIAAHAPLRAATSAMLAGVVLISVASVFPWFAPGSYEIYLALHVLAIVVWVGGVILGSITRSP